MFQGHLSDDVAFGCPMSCEPPENLRLRCMTSGHRLDIPTVSFLTQIFCFACRAVVRGVHLLFDCRMLRRSL